MNMAGLHEKLKVAVYTGGENVPSARFRARQYLNTMPNYGIDLQEFPSKCGSYPPELHWRRFAWFIAGLSERSLQIPKSFSFDAVIFQRELISTFVTVEPFFNKPRIMDVDDAIWLHPRGAFAARLAGHCDAIVCGNEFLADYFQRSRRDVYIIPTAVDTKKFVPEAVIEPEPKIIGWSGTDVNLHELKMIQPALKVVFERFKDCRLRVICNKAPQFDELPSDRIDFIKWSPENEVSSLQDLRVGLMPLQDRLWARGKCSFKMLTYMACGVPVVVSPVGMNKQVLEMGDIGFGPYSIDEWVDALTLLLSNADVARRMGEAGRHVTERFFDVDVLARRYVEVIRGLVC
jgi:glycosyltransferase involved in cell wall biosynthesis